MSCRNNFWTSCFGKKPKPDYKISNPPKIEILETPPELNETSETLRNFVQTVTTSFVEHVDDVIFQSFKCVGDEFNIHLTFDKAQIKEMLMKHKKTHPIVLPPNKYTGASYIVCPYCKSTLRIDGKVFNKLLELERAGDMSLSKPNNCKDCGQSLDWSEIDDPEGVYAQ